MSAVIAFSLLGFDMYLDTKSRADGQIMDGTSDVFVGRHAAVAVGTSHPSSPIPMDVDLDEFGRICYFIDDESFETEEFFKTCYFQDAMLEYKEQ
jgi:hypothetical protein